MRISDWSSDVCSSDLRFRSGGRQLRAQLVERGEEVPAAERLRGHDGGGPAVLEGPRDLPGRREGADADSDRPDLGGGEGGDEPQIGRASCRERVCQYV